MHCYPFDTTDTQCSEWGTIGNEMWRRTGSSSLIEYSNFVISFGVCACGQWSCGQSLVWCSCFMRHSLPLFLSFPARLRRRPHWIPVERNYVDADQFQLQNFECGHIRGISAEQLSPLSGNERIETAATGPNYWQCGHEIVKKGSIRFHQVTIQPNETKRNGTFPFISTKLIIWTLFDLSFVDIDTHTSSLTHLTIVPETCIRKHSN